tara:strand:+ start:207 stop:1172 length:966 start_codon:yes stop_codon:yes gene_type:complete
MTVQFLLGNCLTELKKLKKNSVNTCITSPPYYQLRDYSVGNWINGDPNCNHEKGINRKHLISDSVVKPKEFYLKKCKTCGAERTDNEIGLEDNYEDYINNLVLIFDEVKRVLKHDGTLWLNIGDTYKKDKNLYGIPWRLAFALQDLGGWTLRQDIIWHKTGMPESVKDRCTKAHEYIFLLSKNKNYYFNNEAIKEDCITDYGVATSPKQIKPQSNIFGSRNNINKYLGSLKKNKRSVWKVNTQPYSELHFATFPPKLIEPMILAGSKKNDVILDCFAGAGTTGLVAERHNRNSILIELNNEYIKIAKKRIYDDFPLFNNFI